MSHIEGIHQRNKGRRRWLAGCCEGDLGGKGARAVAAPEQTQLHARCEGCCLAA